jgi:hypothetical protein
MRFPLLCALLSVSLLPAQEKQNLVQDRRNEGLRVDVETSFPLEENVSIEAVLLPPRVTEGLFSKAVSDRYVAIQVIVSNRSRDRSLIVHDIFIDYSRWLLSGSSGNKTLGECEDPRNAISHEKFPDCGNPLQPWQAQTRPNQIASSEYRLPRGTLLDAAPWTWRNLLIRSLEGVGSIASGYVFAFREAGIGKGIAAYNGNFLPVLHYLLPDRTIDQANRISDFGFRVNRVVAEDNSEMMVAFFPIDRFITPRLKKLFMKSPALFFVPHSLLLDDSADAELRPLLEAFGTSKKQLIGEVRKSFESKLPTPGVEFLNRLSLNTVRVLVSGSLVVDERSVPASIEGVEMAGGNTSVDVWQAAGERTGVIRGRNLQGGTPIIVNREALGITAVSAVADGATDNALPLRFTGGAIASGQKLTFRVDKKDKNGKAVEGNTFDLAVSFLPAAPAIDRTELSGGTLTVTGKRLFPTSRTVRLVPSGVMGVKPREVTALQSDKAGELKIDIAGLDLAPACWTPEVTIGTMPAARAPKPFVREPNPKITAAKRGDSRIVVTGRDFIDLQSCGKPLTFEIAQAKDGATWNPATNFKLVSVTEAALDLPATPAGAAWKVRVLVDKVEQDIAQVQ